MLTLRPHQQKALDDIVAGFRTNDRGQYISACGTGKTLTAQRVAERLDARTVIVLAPTIGLLDQFARTWRDNSAWSGWKGLAVCAQGERIGLDSIELSDSELSLPIERDPEHLQAFLKQSGRRVIFCTYTSSFLLTRCTVDLIVFDEAHRTAGPEGRSWSIALDDEQVKAGKRLFCTATPRVMRWTKGQALSMDDAKLYGPVFHSLTYGDAVQAGLVKRIRFAVSEITVGNEPETNTAVLVAIEKLFKETGTSKIITFHSTVRAASLHARQSEPIPGFHISGKMSAAARHTVMNAFRVEASGVLTNARCLTEGIDAPEVDAVGFIDPRNSVIEIMQAIGRASRRQPGPDPQDCFVFLPLFVQPGEMIEEAAERGRFDSVISVVRTVLAHDATAYGDIVLGERALNILDPIFAWTNGDRERLASIIQIGVIDPMRLLDSANEKKRLLLEMALSGKPRPQFLTTDAAQCRLRQSLLNYSSPRSKIYDADFHRQIHAAGWLSRSEVVMKEKAMLLAMARNKGPVPINSEESSTSDRRLAAKLSCWRNYRLKEYDQSFDDALSDAGWLGNNHVEIMRLARRGQPRPLPDDNKQDGLGYWLSVYMNPAYSRYDARWMDSLRTLRPDWFFETIDHRAPDRQAAELLLQKAKLKTSVNILSPTEWSLVRAFTNPDNVRFLPEFTKQLAVICHDWISAADQKRPAAPARIAKRGTIKTISPDVQEKHFNKALLLQRSSTETKKTTTSR